ncbi:unnamed protein product, partial [Larinioides sclopetarius]
MVRFRLCCSVHYSHHQKYQTEPHIDLHLKEMIEINIQILMIS